MIYWLLQESTSESASNAISWGALLTPAIVVPLTGPVIAVIALVVNQYFTNRRHYQLLEAANNRHNQALEQANKIEEERAQRALDLEEHRIQEAALQKYFEQVSNLLADPNLSHRQKGTAIRAHTMTVLQGLASFRKRTVLLFLYELNLINKDEPIVSLSGADFCSAQLTWGKDWLALCLEGACLKGANLADADLSFADLSQANLVDANLNLANLTWTHLNGADLKGAHLTGAILDGTILTYTENLEQDQVNHAKGDEYTLLPFGLKPPKRWTERDGDSRAPMEVGTDSQKSGSEEPGTTTSSDPEKTDSLPWWRRIFE